MEKRLVKTWESGAFDRETNDWNVTTLHKYDYDVPLIEPATPAQITPLDREPADRDFKSIFVFSDAHIGYRHVLNYESKEYEYIPLHDERALKLARYICRDLQPDTIVNLGDSLDLAELSRFDPDSNHFHNTMAPAFQRVHDFYGELRSDNPTAEIIEIDGNHNARLNKTMIKRLPQMVDFTRPGESVPMMSYEYMANLGHLGVKFMSGYGAAEYEYADDLAFIHGTRVGVSPSVKLAGDNPDRNVLQGHTHRAERHLHTDRHGKTLGAFVVGMLGRTDGVIPGFHTSVNAQNKPVKRQGPWTQGVMAIQDYGGYYQFDDIVFQDGRAFYNGKEYNSEPNLKLVK